MTLSLKAAIEKKYKELAEIEVEIDAQIVANLDLRDITRSFDITLSRNVGQGMVVMLKQRYKKEGWNISVIPELSHILRFDPQTEQNYLDAVQERIVEVQKNGKLCYQDNLIVENIYQELVLAASGALNITEVRGVIDRAPDTIKEIFLNDLYVDSVT